LIKSLTSLGINFSGVKEVASNSNDTVKVSKSILILKRWSLITGIFGTLFTIIFSYKLSEYSFGNHDHFKEIIILSISIVISAISSVQLAILQGLQKMKEMVKAGLFGSLLPTIIITFLYYFFGINAIIPGILSISLSSLLFSWLYSRKINVVKVNVSIKDTFNNGLEVVKLGFFITITGLLSNFSLYLLRSIILKNSDLNNVGAFQACWTISSLYLNVLLYPLIADFYPRLSQKINDNLQSSKLINEQLEITILLASPIIISIISFSKLVITIFYSNSFILAVPMLQWQIAATFFTIISWPLGVIFLTSNKGIYSFITEFIKLAIFLFIVSFGWKYFGILSIGIGYLVSYLTSSIAIYLITNNLIKFRYSFTNKKHISFIFIFVLLSLLNVTILEGIMQVFFGCILFTIATLYSYNNISKLVNINKFLLYKIPFFKK
jgi:PST family polysaccharide transporter